MSKREDEFLAQLDAIRNELKEGKKQTATTAVRYSETKPSLKDYLKAGYKNWQWRIAVLLIMLLLIGTIIGIGAYKLFSKAEPVIEKGSFIEQIKDLSSLATSQALVKAIIEKEDNQLFGKEIATNFPGTKRKLLLVVPGTVTAGVDLQQITGEHLKISEEEKKINVILPHATLIQNPSIEFENIEVFSVEGIFREEVNWEEAYELADEAKRLITIEATERGLLENAEEHAQKIIHEFLEGMGYDVSITFVD